jgi:DNA-directed RNA polymerase subunit RPC12/RpoP
MKCKDCGTDFFIWCYNSDCEDNEEVIVETSLSCPNCESFVLFTYPKEREEECHS